jgi:hypothetical protein
MAQKPSPYNLFAVAQTILAAPRRNTKMAVIMQQLANSFSCSAADSSALEASISALKSSISALDVSIRTLEGSSGFWEAVGWWSAIAVGIGVVGELAVIFHDFFDDKSDWARGIMRPPDHPSVRWLWFDVAATVLVVVGIFLEAGASAKVSSINSQLRSKTNVLRAKSELLLAAVTQEVTDADACAKDARTTAKGFEAQIADANSRASKANEVAESERLERIKLEEIVAPRSLSLDQQRAIADACRKFHGHGVLMQSYGMDGEAAALGGQIIAALQSVGIVVADARGGTIATGHFDTGVHVRAPQADIEFANTLADALSKIGKLKVAPVNDPVPRLGSGMGGGGQSFSNPNAIFVTLTVGVKPVPVIPITSNPANK